MAGSESRWCPAHPGEAARGCLGCASDHKAGEHREYPSSSCKHCREALAARQARRGHRHVQPTLTLDVAALAAHDDTIAQVIPLNPRRGRTHP